MKSDYLNLINKILFVNNGKTRILMNNSGFNLKKVDFN